MALPSRQVRLVSWLRWTVVAAHTSLVISTAILLANLGDSTSERAVSMTARAWVMIPDLPVTMLTLLPAYAMGAGSPSPAVRELVFSTVYLFLGGLQWYLIASVVARLTCGFQKDTQLASMRFLLLLALSLLFIGGGLYIPWIARLRQLSHPRGDQPYNVPAVAFSGDSIHLRQSVIVPSLETPLQEGKNTIWCASFQLAWDRLKADVIGEPIRVANAQDVADRLNKGTVTTDTLPDDSYYAAAGLAKDGIADRIRRDMRERFAEEPTDLDDDQAVIMAYAYLQASVPFTLPYFENDEEFHFTDGHGQKTTVSSFGLRAKDESNYFDLREQVDVLYLHKEKEWGQPSEFALDLCRDSEPNQVVLACIPCGDTLASTLKNLDRKIAECQPVARERQLGPNSMLLVPNLHWNISHHFVELEGMDKQLLNSKFAGLYVGTALQTLNFRLDRSGVELQSESRLVAKCADPCFCFDHPFLIVVKKRGANVPFFVMWVDNAGLLSKP